MRLGFLHIELLNYFVSLVATEMVHFERKQPKIKSSLKVRISRLAR